jgi:hypothetical protein
VLMSKSYMKLKKAHPAIWKQLRVALGLPEEVDEEDSEEDEEEEECQQRKSARRET